MITDIDHRVKLKINYLNCLENGNDELKNLCSNTLSIFIIAINITC